MGVEEQQEEREILASIYPDEITDISETEFRISIQLDVGGEPDDENDAAPIILLKIEYPPNYPDEGPRLDILTPPNAPKYEFFDVQEDKANLLEALEPTVEENLGMAMVFTLVSQVKDSAELLISERQNAKQALVEVERKEAEAKENAKFHGTAVTRESFLAWRDRFRAEMAEKAQKEKEEQEAEDLKKRRGAKEEAKLTGRQLWERGIAGKGGEEEDEDGNDALAEALASKAKIEA